MSKPPDHKTNAGDGAPAAAPRKRLPWEIVAEIGAQIPEEAWATAPADASINYRHYLHAAPKRKVPVPEREA